MIYEMEIDTSQTNPDKAVKYIGAIKDYKPLDPRFAEMNTKNGLGIKTETNDNVKINVAITDEPNKEGFVYPEMDGLIRYYIDSMLWTLTGGSLDRLAVIQRINAEYKTGVSE